MRYGQLVFAISFAVVAAASADAQVNDASLANLLNHDSTAVLRLTERGVAMQFTELGVERQRQRGDSAAAGYSNGNGQMALLTRSIVVGMFRGMRFEYPFSEIAAIEARRATVVITFPQHQASGDNTFTFDAVDADAAQRFVKLARDQMRRG